jgi:ureidoacrylate peracid hydrolase
MRDAMPPVAASRTALILVDLQNCFVAGGPVTPPGARALVARLNGLATCLRGAGALVVHTAHVLRADQANGGRLLELPPIRAGMLAAGSASAAIHADVDVRPGDVVLEKPRFGAFHGTDLELVLRTRGVEHVVIGGIATNVCCDTTAREASARDFGVTFLSDGTATFGLGDVDAPTIQAATCASMALFGAVRTLGEVESHYGAARAA